ncbi:GAF domain-containing protein, partial [Candidatus Aminicenantes bacterium AC-335-L06]|nr:GAF domain-containing protein [Candidatus Aminicenantes bacterium AC-335-L06]
CDGQPQLSLLTFSSLTGKSFELNHQVYFQIIGRDITQRKKTEEALRRQRDELATQARIISEILKTFDLNQRLNIILNEVMKLLKVEMGAIHLVEENKLILKCWHGIPESMRVHMLSFPLEDRELMTKEPVISYEHFNKKEKIYDFAKKEKIKVWITLPLKTRKIHLNKETPEIILLGTLTLASRRYKALREKDIKIMKALADQIALAIDHSYQFHYAQQRLKRLGILREIDRAILSSLSTKEILEIIVSCVPKELGADAVAISLLDEDKSKTKIFTIRFPNGTIIKKEVFSIADNLLHWFVKQQEPVVIHDIFQDPRIRVHREYIRKKNLCSYLGVPLIIENNTIGILHILTSKPKFFTDEDKKFFQTIAGQAAIVLKSVKLFEQLKESEEKFHKITESANDAVILVDNKGKISFWNKSAEKIFGYSCKEVIGKDYIQLIIPDKFKESFRKRFAEIKKTGKSSLSGKTIEMEAIRKNGAKFPIELSISPVKIKNQWCSLEIIRDISERKRMETEREYLRLRLKALWDLARSIDQDFQSLYDKILNEIMNLTQSPYAFFGYLNKDETIFSIYSWSNEVMKECFIQEKPQNFSIADAGIWAEAVRQRKVLIINDYQADIPGKKGLPEGHVPLTRIMVVPIFRGNRIIALVGTANKETDYTEKDAKQIETFLTNAQIILDRKQIEEKLRKSEAQLSQAQRIARIGSWEWDIINEKVYGSDETYRILGLKPQDFSSIPKAFLNLVHPEDRELVRKTIVEAMRKKKSFNIEYRIIRPDRKIRNIHCQGKIFYDDTGSPIRMFGTIQDITPLKQTEQKLRLSLKKLKKTFIDTVYSLASLLEMRDAYTAGHQRRVAELASAIAYEMGLPKNQIEGIYMAGIIHDIGKVSVPSEILNKPSRITEPEFDIIKNHSKIGYDILKDIDFPWPVALIILQHHERMNGSGYPQGLKGEDILIEAKIMAVADVVEAMASHRPYRAALGLDKALNEITKGKKILYDAKVVDVCIELFTKKGFKFH